MQGWMKKNQKKLMALFAAVLMVSFLITAGPLGNSLVSGARSRGPAIATIGKTDIYADDRKQADVEWKILEQSYYIDRNEGQPMRAIELAGPAIANQIKDHPELFMLLIKEAELRGINVSDDVVKTAVQNQIHSIYGLPADANYDSAVHHLLMVQALRNQLVSNVKFSEPQWKHLLAEQYRQIRLNLVEFNAEQLSHTTPAPTTQQVVTLYDQYKSVLADNAPKAKDDSLTFAYEVPDRVKLQYVTISRDQILKAAREAHRDPHDKPGDLPYDLKVRALEYYLKNQTEFVRPAPETKPETAPTTLSRIDRTGHAPHDRPDRFGATRYTADSGSGHGKRIDRTHNVAGGACRDNTIDDSCQHDAGEEADCANHPAIRRSAGRNRRQAAEERSG